MFGKLITLASLSALAGTNAALHNTAEYEEKVRFSE